MIIKPINKNFFIIKIFNVKDIDIYDREEVVNLIKNVLKRLIKKRKINGLVDFDIYFDINYGIIIEIKINNIVFYDDEIDIKINCYIVNFLYEIDYFDMVNIDYKSVYFYNNKYYLQFKKKVDNCKCLPLLEQYNIIYKDIDKIIDSSIKLI